MPFSYEAYNIGSHDHSETPGKRIHVVFDLNEIKPVSSYSIPSLLLTFTRCWEFGSFSGWGKIHKSGNLCSQATLTFTRPCADVKIQLWCELKRAKGTRNPFPNAPNLGSRSKRGTEQIFAPGSSLLFVFAPQFGAALKARLRKCDSTPPFFYIPHSSCAPYKPHSNPKACMDQTKEEWGS